MTSCKTISREVRMLDLEVIPERALGGAQWELVLGQNRVLTMSNFIHLYRVIRYAACSSSGNFEATVGRHKESAYHLQ